MNDFNVLDYFKGFEEGDTITVTSDFINSAEYLIERIKELEAIEEEHRKENGKLREKIRGLEIEAGELNGLADVVIKDYIPKSKIKAKIEEYRHKDFIKLQVCYKHDEEALKIAEVLEELLEEQEDK